jgi:hypothetical protein
LWEPKYSTVSSKNETNMADKVTTQFDLSVADGAVVNWPSHKMIHCTNTTYTAAAALQPIYG